MHKLLPKLRLVSAIAMIAFACPTTSTAQVPVGTQGCVLRAYLHDDGSFDYVAFKQTGPNSATAMITNDRDAVVDWLVDNCF